MRNAQCSMNSETNIHDQGTRSVVPHLVKKSTQRARKKLRGGCSCGHVRYQLLDAPMRVHCCHCTDCQRHTGSAFVLNAIIETSAIKILRGKLQAVQCSAPLVLMK